jgi:hypothetical protein
VRLAWLPLLAWPLFIPTGCATGPPLEGCISTAVTGSGKHRVTHYYKGGYELDREHLADAVAALPEAREEEQSAHRYEKVSLGLFGFGYALVPTALLTMAGMAAGGALDNRAGIVIGTAMSAMVVDMAALLAVSHEAQHLRRRGLERYNDWAAQNGCQ